MRHQRTCWTALSGALICAPLAVGLTACSSDSHSLAAAPYDASAQLTASVEDGSKTVASDKPLEVSVKDGEGRITDVVATDASGRWIGGRLSDDGTHWRSTDPLAAGVRYTVRIRTENDDGAPGRRVLHFTTKQTHSKRLTVAFGPEGGTYGVGQPLVATLSRAVKDPAQRAVVEHGLKVESTPSVTGDWHWVDDKTLHYRPKEYWPADTTVTVRSTLDGVRIRDGLRGGSSKPVHIRIGDRVISVVDLGAHTMTVTKNGKTLREIPISAGKPGFRSRTGIKIVLSKTPLVEMRSTSIGIPAGSPDSYDLQVHWDTRLTQSGEFVHAAPWSAGAQGVANTSHGCTGMSMENAKWFFDLAHKGDVVKYVNGDGDKMPVFGNGYGDWNMSWADWNNGGAKTGRSHPTENTVQAARLRPRL
jgi:lipoprotein-anchoring transpeptidase ErfK/SrfK